MPRNNNRNSSAGPSTRRQRVGENGRYVGTGTDPRRLANNNYQVLNASSESNVNNNGQNRNNSNNEGNVENLNVRGFRPGNRMVGVNSLTTLLPHQKDALRRVQDVIQQKPIEMTLYKYGTNLGTRRVDPRGHLFWLKTGAGKTAVGAGIAASYLLNDVRLPGEEVFVIVLSSREVKKVNDGPVYGKELQTHYKNWMNAPVGGGKTLANMINKNGFLSNVRFWNYKMAWSAFGPKNQYKAYEKHRKAIRNGTARFVIIVDEIHDLVSTSASRPRGEADDIENLRQFLTGTAPFMVSRISGKPMFTVFGMSATPGDSVRELANTFAIIGPYIREVDGNVNNTTNITKRSEMRIDFYKAALRDVGPNNTKNTSRVLMSSLMLWRDPRTMKNSSGGSIFPHVTVLPHNKSMPMSQYLIQMRYLGRMAGTTLYRSENSGLGKMRYFHSSSVRRTGNRTLETVPYDKKTIKGQGLQPKLFKEGHFLPHKGRWMDEFARLGLYLTEDDVRQLIPGGVEQFRKNFGKQYVKVKLPTFQKDHIENGREVNIRKDVVYYVPKSGKLNNVVSTIIDRSQKTPGRQLVYVKDPTAAKLIGKLLETILDKNERPLNRYEDLSPFFAQRRSPAAIDMMFNFHDNGRNKLINKNTIVALEYLFRLHIRPVSQKRRFVVATNATQVSRAAAAMDVDADMARLIRIVEDKLRVMNTSRPNDRRNYGEYNSILESMKKYNMKGEYLETLIIGGGNLFQGLNIRAIRHLHIVDEMHFPKHLDQLKGRGSRGFGHHGLSPTNRTLVIHTYTSTVPKEPVPGDPTKRQPRLRIETIGRTLNNATTLALIRTQVARTFKNLNDAKRANQNTIDEISGHVLEGIRFLHWYQSQMRPRKTGFSAENMTVNKVRETHREYKKSYVEYSQLLDNLKKAAARVNT